MTLEKNFSLPFHDRADAGKLLGEALRSFSDRKDTVVLALPRGGVPVAAEIARILKSPLYVFVVRKLGVPGNKELAMGAIASGGKRLINRAVTNTLHIAENVIESITSRETAEQLRRERLYGRGHHLPELKDKIVFLVDDGIATGSSMMIAVQALRECEPGWIVVAVPVAPAAAVSQLNTTADQVICLAEPEPFVSVGTWYDDFDQVTDHDVCIILDELFERRTELKTA